MMKKFVLLIATIAMMISSATAGTNISSDIASSAHWTKAGSPYHLKTQIFVLPGATLTIDAGVVVASYVADQGSLAVCRGAQIYVNGTAAEPVIMTSANDVATWDGSVITTNGSGDVTAITTMGDPKTGTWREACNEWGNLTLMGNALISASHYGGNPVQINNEGSIRTNDKCPNGLNEKTMEGLTAAYVGDSKVLYGGDNDDDNSGSISYLSIRYGGKVIGLANELNGLSLGGIGRGTSIDHVEIMNNVDDGIEIWGGTVELSHVSIWNIGDDSLDVDQGWRGSASNGLIVQGYSIDASQGSGVGDNCIETDGAEDSDAQPVTTARVSDFTVIGQPIDGDGATTWRDNARIQYNNCIFMDIGEKLVRPDGDDGDGANGYGYNGTLSWADTWTTAAGTTSTVNLCGFDPALIYGAYATQDPAGKLAQISDSIFYNVADYAEASARGVLDAVNNNIQEPSEMPIQELVRADYIQKGGKFMQQVTFINPCPVDGVDAGAFGKINWLASWTATDAYGMTDTSMNAANGDMNVDGQVDLADYMILSENWLQ